MIGEGEGVRAKGMHRQFVLVMFQRAGAPGEAERGYSGVASRNLVTRRLYIIIDYVRLRGKARLSINSSSQDINVLYIARDAAPALGS